MNPSPGPLLLRLAVLLLATFMIVCASAQSTSPKKGVGYWNADGTFNRVSSSVDHLGCSWYYNWTPIPDPKAQDIKAQFIPMIWDAGQANEANFDLIGKSGAKILLGFNEPDASDQAHMKVEEAVALWPRLMKTGLRLGSPAPAVASQETDWLGRFMKEAEARQFRVDFICLHWYGDITAPDAVEQLRTFLETQWKRYHRPLWLTEFSGSTGGWLKLANPPMTLEKNAAFIRAALPMLESLPYLERYAWFEMKWVSAPWGQVALVSPLNGHMTEVGQAYLSAGKKVE